MTDVTSQNAQNPVTTKVSGRSVPDTVTRFTGLPDARG